MRVFVSAVVLGLSVVGAAVGGEVAADGTQSVLVQPAIVTAAPVVVASAIVAEPASKHGNCPCANGRCSTGPQLYNAESSYHESCRNRLLGGTVVRKSNRTVYKPVRR